MNNIFNIYKGVPNPTQLVLIPRVNTDLSSAKIEIFNFQKTKVFEFTVGSGLTINSGKIYVSQEIQNLKNGYYTAILYLLNAKSSNPLILKVK